ncbi:MAG: TonB-dependent receptor [Nannocystis sp.]|nr:TonB-dependent receptor [Nannocystis sp.]
MPDIAFAASDGTISGVVSDQTSGDKIESAIVVLQCACIQGTRETRTNADGLYSFRNLPPGTYTIQVLYGQADVSKITNLPRGAKFRANFSLDPKNEFKKTIVVESKPVRSDPTVSTRITMEQAKNIPVGGTSRDFTAVVDLSPTASRDSAGIRLAGTTGAESKYVVDGANVTSPAFGTVGATIVQEFVEEVEVKESGYDAELGGASGGVVSARRIGGTNKFRGQAVVRVTPRFAQPRFIAATDESLRVASVPNVEGEGVFTLTGPIIKDKLFFAVGVNPKGLRRSLIQSFYARDDKDGSGGYSDCPYKNGDFDCVDGGNYIQSTKFAEQRFATGNFVFGYVGRLDWVINPKHRLILSGGGGPSFDRTTFRLPLGSEPASFGTNPSESLGGQSRIASGIVNNHFGTSFGNSTQFGLTYEGRVRDDKVEIDAGISYYQARSIDAWKLDNPELKNIPLTQEGDTQGRNLYEFLDRDGAVRLVPKVDEFCNNAELPGLACPTRRWLSGGLGAFNDQAVRRVEGHVYLTHFFNALGSHQVKYGGIVEHLERKIVETFSGANASDFYNDCGPGQIDGGEYCYNPATNQYAISTANRVNNNRVVIVDSDNPNNRSTRGYGRIREEQGDLRAIASPIGAGVRAPNYNSRLTTQNYGMFLQDKWAVLSNLFINAGVRWEMQDMRDVLGERQIFIWDNVAPRVGIVYDWTDEGRSRLFASYGWFYQQLPLQLNSRVFGGLVTVFRSYRASDCEGTVNINGVDQVKSVDGNPTEYCTDFNSATTGLTAGSIVPKLKGQYNEQFQLGYEQEVIEDLVLGVQWLHTNLGRAVEDVSTNGGLNFLIANPGESVSQADIMKQQGICSQLQGQFDMAAPDDGQRDILARELNRCNFLTDAYQKVNTLYDKPTRNYDAWTMRLQKRFAKNWVMTANYTYSRLIGNYDGFVDRNTGAINIGASTQYDIPELVRNSFGPLFNNVPHSVKLDGFYSFDLKEAGRLTLGSSVRFQSGSPINTLADNNRYQGAFLIQVLPRGTFGRLEPNYFWSASLGYSYPLPGELELEFNARIINLTNAKATLRVDEVYSFQQARAVAGGDVSDLKHVKIQNPGAPTDFYQRTILAKQGNYQVPVQFQSPVAGQFELRLRF